MLPKLQATPRRAGDLREIIYLEHDKTPITCSLNELRPLQVEVVSSKDKLVEFKSYIDQFHYLKFDRYIGEHMAYMIHSSDGDMHWRACCLALLHGRVETLTKTSVGGRSSAAADITA